MTFDHFRSRFNGHLVKDELTIMVSRLEDIGDQIFVFFVDLDRENKKISNNVLLKYYERMKTEGVLRSILVLPEKLDIHAEKSLQSIREGSNGAITVETFQETE